MIAIAIAAKKLEMVIRRLWSISRTLKIKPTTSPKRRSHTILGICVLLKMKFPINPRIIIAPSMIRARIISNIYHK